MNFLKLDHFHHCSPDFHSQDFDVDTILQLGLYRESMHF